MVKCSRKHALKTGTHKRFEGRGWVGKKGRENQYEKIQLNSNVSIKLSINLFGREKLFAKPVKNHLPF